MRGLRLNKPSQCKKPSPKGVSFWAAVIGGIWFVLVILQGLFSAHHIKFIDVDFELSGQFGDSFGGLSAIMASLAALGAWEAVKEQRTALKASNDREELLNDLAEKRDFETTFFNLLNTFQSIVSDIDVSKFLSTKTGKDAFTFFVKKIVEGQKNSEATLKQSFERVFDEYRSDLGHYFRLLYNIVVFVKNQRPKDCYFYIKLIRATLSEAELTMIALNGLHHPEGEENFKPLIEEFSLLNNLSDYAQASFDLGAYNIGAFKRGSDDE